MNTEFGGRWTKKSNIIRIDTVHFTYMHRVGIITFARFDMGKELLTTQ